MPLLQYTSNTDHVYWLATCLEAKLQISAALYAVQQQELAAQNTKSSKMNRLQRSMVHDRVVSVAKDSTVQVSRFLAFSLKSLNSYLNAFVTQNDHWAVSYQTSPWPVYY